MKKQLSTILLLVLCAIANAQEYKDEIKKDFQHYMALLANGDFDDAMTYVPSQYFEIIPKSEAKAKMEESLNNPAMEFHLSPPTNMVISDAQYIGGKYYSLIAYNRQMDIRIKNEGKKTDPNSKRFDLIELYLNRKFGDENVSYNEKTDFFEILVEKQSCSISENGKDNWKFLDFDEKQEDLLEEILPEEIMDKL